MLKLTEEALLALIKKLENATALDRSFRFAVSGLAAMCSYPDMTGEITTFAFVAPFPSDPVLKMPKRRLWVGQSGAFVTTTLVMRG